MKNTAPNTWIRTYSGGRPDLVGCRHVGQGLLGVREPRTLGRRGRTLKSPHWLLTWCPSEPRGCAPALRKWQAPQCTMCSGLLSRRGVTGWPSAARVAESTARFPAPLLARDGPSGAAALAVVLFHGTERPVFGVEEGWWSQKSRGRLCSARSSQHGLV